MICSIDDLRQFWWIDSNKINIYGHIGWEVCLYIYIINFTSFSSIIRWKYNKLNLVLFLVINKPWTFKKNELCKVTWLRCKLFLGLKLIKDLHAFDIWPVITDHCSLFIWSWAHIFLLPRRELHVIISVLEISPFSESLLGTSKWFKI
jgi:hypothetical protein